MDTSTSTAAPRPLKRKRLNERVDTSLISLESYRANDAYINRTFKIRALGAGDGTFKDSWSRASTFDKFFNIPRDTKTITKLDMNTIALYINDFVKDDFARVKVRVNFCCWFEVCFLIARIGCNSTEFREICRTGKSISGPVIPLNCRYFLDKFVHNPLGDG